MHNDRFFSREQCSNDCNPFLNSNYLIEFRRGDCDVRWLGDRVQKQHRRLCLCDWRRIRERADPGWSLDHICRCFEHCPQVGPLGSIMLIHSLSLHKPSPAFLCIMMPPNPEIKWRSESFLITTTHWFLLLTSSLMEGLNFFFFLSSSFFFLFLLFLSFPFLFLSFHSVLCPRNYLILFFFSFGPT